MQKQIQIEGLDMPILLARRKGTRSIRLSVKSDGVIRVSVPYGIPEFMARKFVLSKRDWIAEHHKPQRKVSTSAHIGKSHTLTVEIGNSTRANSRISDTTIKVILPAGAIIGSATSQATIRKACEKALLQESEHLLPQRLETLSKIHKIDYKSCEIKKLKSRWGACDNRKNITLNSYLIQLDWKLIDYVLCHELAHTHHHHHQASFWELVDKMQPNNKVLRKELKSMPTDILPTTF